MYAAEGEADIRSEIWSEVVRTVGSYRHDVARSLARAVGRLLPRTPRSCRLCRADRRSAELLGCRSLRRQRETWCREMGRCFGAPSLGNEQRHVQIGRSSM